MNKKKGIIIGVFSLVITMVVGYALFGKNIEIKGTATASGNFELSYTCEKEEYGGTGTCTIKDNQITTTSTFTKPTDTVQYSVTITNNGTIPAKLITVDSPNNYNIVKLVDDAELVDGDSYYLDTATFLGAQYDLSADNVTSLYGDSAVEAANIILQPGKSLNVIIGLGWFDSNLLGMSQPELPNGTATINYDITFGFEQITN